MVYPATKTGQTTTIYLLIKIAPNFGDNGILLENVCIGSNKWCVYEKWYPKRENKNNFKTYINI